jgi:hypothetical protein
LSCGSKIRFFEHSIESIQPYASGF